VSSLPYLEVWKEGGGEGRNDVKEGREEGRKAGWKAGWMEGRTEGSHPIKKEGRKEGRNVHLTEKIATLEIRLCRRLANAGLLLALPLFGLLVRVLPHLRD
jgi:hypothetical protein